MHRLFVLKKEKCGGFAGHALITISAFLLCSGIGAWAQSATTTSKTNPPVSIRATHLLGFSNTKSNSKGTLTAQDNGLRFEQSDKAIAQIDIASVRNVYLGEESSAGRRNANEDRQGCGSVRKWPSRQSLCPQKIRHADPGIR